MPYIRTFEPRKAPPVRDDVFSSGILNKQGMQPLHPGSGRLLSNVWEIDRVNSTQSTEIEDTIRMINILGSLSRALGNRGFERIGPIEGDAIVISGNTSLELMRNALYSYGFSLSKVPDVYIDHGIPVFYSK